MAIINNSSKGRAAINVVYSAFLGMLHLRDEPTLAAIAEVKKEIGDETWKQGFTGGGNTPSGKARQLLKERGVFGVDVVGRLTSARVKDREIKGRTHKYLTVGLADEDGQTYISVEMGQEAAQKLVRKLVNAQPNVETVISLFGTMDPIREGATRAYASHAASLRQGNAQVPAIPTGDGLKKAVDGVMAAFKDASIAPEVLRAARNSAVTNYHLGLMEGVNERFQEFFGNRSTEAEDHDEAGVPADEMSDEPM